MIKFFYKHRKPIYLTIVAVFLMGIFVGLGSYIGSDASSFDAAATIGGEKITMQDFYREYNRQAEQLSARGLTEIPEALRGTIKQQVLQQMVVNKALELSAGDYKIRPSDFEVAAVVQSNPAFYREGKFVPQLYAYYLMQNMKMQPRQYESFLRGQLAASHFRMLLLGSAKMTPQEFDAAYALYQESQKQNKEKGKSKTPGKAEVMKTVLQSKGLSIANSYLRQYTQDHPFKNLLDQREKGL